jgi:SAM-dependent methyltransferase
MPDVWIVVVTGMLIRPPAVAGDRFYPGRAGHDGGVAEEAVPDWAGYYAWSAGREPRPLLVAACQELGAGRDRLAIDLGCGHGTEALELLARGWSVLAVDAQKAGLAVLRARIPPGDTERIRILCASFTEAGLPPAYLIHAGFSLPFCPPQEFAALWARIRQALVPRGVFADQLFGTRDSWAEDPAMTFHDRRQAAALLDGLQILRLQETEYDGHAFTGPKHWHIFDTLARHQPSVTPAGLPATPPGSQITGRRSCAGDDGDGSAFAGLAEDNAERVTGRVGEDPVAHLAVTRDASGAQR